jgi:hypothetical protein
MRRLIISHLPTLSSKLHIPSPHLPPHLIPDSVSDFENVERTEAKLQAAYEKGGVQAWAWAVAREVEREARGERGEREREK